MSKRSRKVAFSDEIQVEDKRRRGEVDENEAEEKSRCALFRITVTVNFVILKNNCAIIVLCPFSLTIRVFIIYGLTLKNGIVFLFHKVC